MNKYGGKRKGAGRPKGSLSKTTIQEREARKVLVDEILKDWKPLIDAKKRLALGDYYFEGRTRKGEVRIYKAKPDSNSAEDLINRVIGKPNQSVDVTSGGEPIIGFKYIEPIKNGGNNSSNKA